MGMIWIFGGTSEGRKLASFCEDRGLDFIISVATEYGGEVLDDRLQNRVLCGRLQESQMEACMEKYGVELVIDATHPYAVEVTKNIKSSCEKTGVEYIRIRRQQEMQTEHEGPDTDIHYAASATEAAQYLKHTTGNIMLTTGSKELSVFCQTLEKQRLYARVLPSAESIAVCEQEGIVPGQRIAMQGPFSEAVNAALLEQFGCRYLVTKESGKAGGFEEKIAACKRTGVTAVVIRRPREAEGMSLETLCEELERRYSGQRDYGQRDYGQRDPGQRDSGQKYSGQAGREFSKAAVSIDIIGIGMGSEAVMTLEGKAAIDRADVLIGGGRMLEPYRRQGRLLFDCYQPEKIRDFIFRDMWEKLPETMQEKSGNGARIRVAVLMSGDVGFYSGTRKLLDVLDGCPVGLYPGISSPVYLAARIGITWQDMILCSLHGRNQNLTAKIRRNPKVFALAGSGDEIRKVCDRLCRYEMEHVEVYVGENLSYPEERIWHGSPEECRRQTFGRLCAAVFLNRKAERLAALSGIPDEAFLRGKVPMTKEEVRTISISKLKLAKDAVVYDIGAGTGSVSIEAALTAEDGMVYAIEKKEEAAELIEANRERFGVDNLQIVRGEAPEALEKLPVPTHAFIGGSSGNLKEIVDLLEMKNPQIRIVINAISLETIGEMTELAKTRDMELITVSVAKASAAGRYHLMTGQNPVMIGTIKGRQAE